MKSIFVKSYEIATNGLGYLIENTEDNEAKQFIDDIYALVNEMAEEYGSLRDDYEDLTDKTARLLTEHAKLKKKYKKLKKRK